MSEEPGQYDTGRKPNPWPEPRWLEAHESPFGIRVYDCRKVTVTMILGSLRRETVDEYLKTTMGFGEQFRGTVLRDALRVPCELIYQNRGEVTDGRYSRPECMEDVWCVDFYDGWFQFVNAMESQVVYRARLAPIDAERVALTEVEAHPNRAAAGPDHALDAVDFLMKAYLFRRAAPHPFPPAFRGDPTSNLASYSFWEYGRRALFGTFEPTRGLPGYPWDFMTVLHHGRNPAKELPGVDL